MKIPEFSDAQRCLDLRCRCKRGEFIPPDDHKFVEKMFRTYPAWYNETEKIVFKRTMPFGAV